MADFADHAANSWRVFQRPAAVHFVQAQANQRLLILHSFGLHLCPIATIQQADQVVIFSSFLCFHPEDPRRNRRSKRVVGRMSDRFQTHPLEVLQQFWDN